MKYQTPMTIPKTMNGPMTSTRNDFHAERRGGGSSSACSSSSCTGRTSTDVTRGPLADVCDTCPVSSAKLELEAQLGSAGIGERHLEVADDPPGPADITSTRVDRKTAS